MEFDSTHFEWRRVVVPHEVVDETLIFANVPSTSPVRHAGGLNDRVIVAHVVYDTQEAVIEHLTGVNEIFSSAGTVGRRVNRLLPRSAAISSRCSSLSGINPPPRSLRQRRQ